MMIEWSLVLEEFAFKRRVWLFDGAQIRLLTQLVYFMGDGKIEEGKKKDADVWEVKTVFISGGWPAVTQIEPPLLPYTVPVFARQSIADPMKG
jgi:hypothetical protein